MRQGGLGQKVKGGIVVNDVSFQDAAVTVIGILAKTYIGYNVASESFLLGMPKIMMAGILRSCAFLAILRRWSMDN